MKNIFIALANRAIQEGWRRILPVAGNHYPHAKHGVLQGFVNESGVEFDTIAVLYPPEDDSAAGLWWTLIETECYLCSDCAIDLSEVDENLPPSEQRCPSCRLWHDREKLMNV